MELQGTLKRWNDDKGFGFIRPAAGGEEVFVHISAVRGDQRPRVGEPVAYIAARDEQGRLRCKHMRAAGALSLDDPSIRRRPRTAVAATDAAKSSAGRASRPAAVSARGKRRQGGIDNLLLKLVLLAWLCVLPVWGSLQALAAGWPWIGSGYLLLSLASFCQYWSDKRRAQAGQWRTRESRLHLFALLGGWPGALMAQQVFRHKTRKLDFQIICWGCVAVHQVFWLERLVLGGRFLGPLGIPGL